MKSSKLYYRSGIKKKKSNKHKNPIKHQERMCIDLITRLAPLRVQVVFSACELGVFDALLSAQRPLSAEEIGRATGASLDGTERLLAACTGLRLLNTQQQDGRGQQQQPGVLHVSVSDYVTPRSLLLLPPCSRTTCPSTCACCSAVQQHRAGQALPDPLQPTVALPVHPVQLQNHLPVLALPHRRRQVQWSEAVRSEVRNTRFCCKMTAKNNNKVE